MAVKKLIEVALPLDAINAAAAREKNIRFGNPSTMHLWWARRPLAAARAVIWSSLVDDPSSHPDEYPTPEDQNAERQRLFGILEDLVTWKNSNNGRVLDAAYTEVLKSMGGDLPALLDPFAGGGAIPLEAQRLGLEAFAADLNPVAVLINKASVEIPPIFAGNCAVNPDDAHSRTEGSWEGTEGLVADIKYYGKWMQDEAYKRIGKHYPNMPKPRGLGGGTYTPIAWIWARTIACPNPACAKETALVRSFDLSRRKGQEAHIEVDTHDGKMRFTVESGKSRIGGTIGKSGGGTCIHCGSSIPFDYIRQKGQERALGSRMMAIVAEGDKGRVFLSPDEDQINAAVVARPDDCPSCILSGKSKVNVGLYGFEETEDLFTDRQLLAMTTFCELVNDVREVIKNDAIAIGMNDDKARLVEGGSGATAYADAVSVYLSFLVDKLADRCSSMCSWDSSPRQLSMRNVFGRQAIAMAWDYAEANPFSSSTGSFSNNIRWVTDVVDFFPKAKKSGHARQFDAQSDNGLREIMVSTDPPYYNNIDYADLSDFFYVWLRYCLKDVYPTLFSTIATPKNEELIASAYRGRSVEESRDFFENGMYRAFQRINTYSTADVPVTVYYAFKQSETETANEVESTASTGWETMLSAIIHSGFSITGTWPMRTEMGNRAVASGSNALASSIVLVCRKRNEDAFPVTRRDFVNTLKRELKPALDKLQTSNIAPVDLAQSAIGPGIGVYSRFSKVLEADGSEMTVRSALQIINQELDLYFSDQDSEIDRESRFCVDLFTQYAFNDIRFGDADNLARAKNTSVEGITAKGALSSSKGVVRLLGRDEIKDMPAPDFCWLFTQQLTHAMETGGIEACAKMLKDVYDSRAENAKALAYRLFTIADKKGWAQEAFAYNSLVVAWPDIQARAAQLQQETPVQTALDI